MTSTRFKCPTCNFTCGRQKKFNEHLVTEHEFNNIEDAYTVTRLNGNRPVCACNTCGLHTNFKSWNKGFNKFIDGHNGNIYSAYDQETAWKISKKRSDSLIGQTGWSKGLTKETNESIKQGAIKRSKTVKAQFDSGERSSWSKGLTKETDSRLMVNSQRLKQQYASGELIPWAKGLTKETDPRILEMSYAVSRKLKEKNIRSRLDSLKRLTQEEIIRRLSIGAPDLKLFSGLDDYTRDRDKNLVFECRTCKHLQNKSLLSALSNRCDKCNPAGSKQQVEVDRFVRSLGFETNMCDRTVINPYEIDIFIPDKNFGIEFNGLYFHSELYKDRHYHSDKTIKCAEVDVGLIHIFDDEWREKQEICKSMIAHKLGISKQTVFARKCVVKPVGVSTRRDFFNKNHIDGDVKSTCALGLFYNDELISCMSLRMPFHKKYKGQLEIARFCTKLYTRCPGGLSRLTKYALQYCVENGFTSLLTYVDTRLGTKAGYATAGWNFEGRTVNRFWWTDGRNRIDRFKIRADKTNNMTEKEVAESLGVVKIWGCPNLIFTKK